MLILTLNDDAFSCLLNRRKNSQGILMRIENYSTQILIKQKARTGATFFLISPFVNALFTLCSANLCLCKSCLLVDTETILGFILLFWANFKDYFAFLYYARPNWKIPRQLINAKSGLLGASGDSHVNLTTEVCETTFFSDKRFKHRKLTEGRR